MAKIFVAYADDADAKALALSRSLASAGHEIGHHIQAGLPLADALKAYDAVVVVWSRGGSNSAHLMDVARTASGLGSLIAMRPDGVPDDAVPEAFRGVSAPFTSDVALLTTRIVEITMRRAAVATASASYGRPAPAPDKDRSLATMRRPVAGGEEAPPPAAAKKSFHIGGAPAAEERVERERADNAAAPSPVRKRDPVEDALAAGAAGGALEIEAGKLVHKIPNRMRVGEPETVEVRVGREAVVEIATGMIGKGALVSEDIPIVETMSVSLYARGGAFDIERQSETTQLVRKDAVANTLFGAADFASWVWRVTPRRAGEHMLCVKVSAGLTDSRGVPATASLPDREFAVSVSVNASKAAKKALSGFAVTALGALAAAFVGAITQDVWWPWLKDLLWP